MVTPPGE